MARICGHRVTSIDRGEVAERFKAAVLKTVVPGRVPGVRIPSSPPTPLAALPRWLRGCLQPSRTAPFARCDDGRIPSSPPTSLAALARWCRRRLQPSRTTPFASCDDGRIPSLRYRTRVPSRAVGSQNKLSSRHDSKSHSGPPALVLNGIGVRARAGAHARAHRNLATSPLARRMHC
jgi:hypothetical protein